MMFDKAAETDVSVIPRWYYRTNQCKWLLTILLYIILPSHSQSCQSIATIDITELHSDKLTSNTVAFRPEAWSGSLNSHISVNLTDLFIQTLKLSPTDLNSPMYFSDAEQSEPFLIRRRNDLAHSRNPNNPSWYELTTTVPVDREAICDARRFPERASVSETCCPSQRESGYDSSLSYPQNGPCCVFLGITLGSKGTHFIRIDIADLNDQAPRYQEFVSGKPLVMKHDAYGKYQISIPENTPQGQWIPLPKATDLDEGANAIVQYSVKLSPDDRLWNHYFKLMNNVQNANLAPNILSTKVYINDDKNELTVLASEYSGPGLLILQKLDRETVANFLFALVASDLGQPFSKSNVLNIWIKILDENDNPPVFDKSEFKVTVNENQAGVSLLQMRINDSDVDNNARFHYQMRPSRTSDGVSPDFLRMHVQMLPTNEGLTLRISQPLDYETHPSFSFDVIATDQGHPSQSATAHVEVSVVNVNDNAPIIRFYHHGQALESNYAQVSVYEHVQVNGSIENAVLCHVHVTDLDNDLSNVHCSIETAKHGFELREVMTNRVVQKRKIYELVSITPLDRESSAQSTIVVRCQDGTSETSLIGRNQVQILIKDRNDNAPSFSQGHYRGHVRENAANAVVTMTKPSSVANTNILNSMIHASDADTGSNAQITYSLLALPDPSPSEVEINVKPVPEHSPIEMIHSNNSEHDVDIRKSSSNFTNTGKHFRSQPISKDVESFYIDPLSGQLRTRVALNCEEQETYEFMVLATDQAQAPEQRFTASARVTVLVDDENDKPPVLDQRHYMFEIQEGLPRHTMIGQIKATDLDKSPDNRIINYELRDVVNINASNYIFLETHTGIIRSRKVLDREEIQQIPFIVIARNEKPKSKGLIGFSNGTSFYDEASVTINILDQNDNPPVMIKRGQIQNKQSVLAQPAVVDLKYNLNSNDPFNPCIEFPYYFGDADEGPNADLQIKMEPNPYFEFRLDYSIICKISTDDPPPGQYNLHIEVQDCPTDISTVMKRRYTIRMHVVNEPSLIQADSKLTNNKLFDKDYDLKTGVSAQWLQASTNRKSDSTGTENGKHPSKSNSMVYVNEAYQSKDSTELANRQGINIITTVAVLISVVGLLCLFLIGVVIAMKRVVPGQRNDNPGFLEKPVDKQHDGRPLSQAWNSFTQDTGTLVSDKLIDIHPEIQQRKCLPHDSIQSYTIDTRSNPCRVLYSPTLNTMDSGCLRCSPSIGQPTFYGPFRLNSKCIDNEQSTKLETQLTVKHTNAINMIKLRKQNQSDCTSDRPTLSRSCDELRILNEQMNNFNNSTDLLEETTKCSKNDQENLIMSDTSSSNKQSEQDERPQEQYMHTSTADKRNLFCLPVYTLDKGHQYHHHAQLHPSTQFPTSLIAPDLDDYQKLDNSNRILQLNTFIPVCQANNKMLWSGTDMANAKSVHKPLLYSQTNNHEPNNGILPSRSMKNLGVQKTFV